MVRPRGARGVSATSAPSSARVSLLAPDPRRLPGLMLGALISDRICSSSRQLPSTALNHESAAAAVAAAASAIALAAAAAAARWVAAAQWAAQRVAAPQWVARLALVLLLSPVPGLRAVVRCTRVRVRDPRTSRVRGEEDVYQPMNSALSYVARDDYCPIPS
eukprot:COSAG01_NODE_1602_length_9759_cov_35.078157_1_plen_162_part_00